MKIYLHTEQKAILDDINEISLDCKCLKELKANTTDGAKEKHVPVVEVKDNICNVVVGSTVHPMTSEHLIEFIIVVTTNGIYRKNLTPNDEPKASFALLPSERVIEVYEYCNLHGLWKVVL